MSASHQAILVADDNAQLRYAMQLALQAAGYAVRVAGNGREALEIQRQDPAGLLITDIFMPESDGFEAITGFRREFPDTKIVAISGDTSRVRNEYLPVAELIGVDATLRKPFDMPALVRTVRSVLEG
jgi:CheY-like chemotaxis protein